MVKLCCARLALMGALVLSPLILSPLATAQDAEVFSDAEQGEIESLVRDYILENPEIIEDALVALQLKREMAEVAAAETNILENWDALAFNANDFSVGPEDAPVTIIEFFDYNCGFCKTSATYVQELIDTHGDDVRIVFKETPIFADRYDGSTAAARAALAAIPQDQYLDLHFALMAHRGVLDARAVNKIAKEEGLRMRWLTNAMAEPEIDAHIEATLALGETVGLRGTPYFIVNGQPVNGANFDLIDALIAEALADTDA